MTNFMTRGLTVSAIVIGAAALILAVTPWLGNESNKLDRLAAFFPLSIPLALFALLLGYRLGKLAILAFLILMLCLIARVLAPEMKGGLYRSPVAPTQLTLVTHNVKGFNFDPAGTVRILQNSGADILLLQEWGARMEAVRPALLKTFPYGESCGTMELQIFSRYPIQSTHCAPTTIGPAGQMLVWSEIMLPSKQTVTVMTLHPTWRLSKYWRREGRKALISFVHKMKPDYLILAGDFNITPWNQGMRDLGVGLAPLRRISRAQFTFPARVRGYAWPIPLLPIDHVFVGPGIEDAAVDRLARSGSDHFGLRVKLRLRDVVPANVPGAR